MKEFINNILPLIVSGYYNDWFFNVLLVKSAETINNNLLILVLFATLWQRISKKTKNTWDDKLSGWLVKKLRSKFKIGINAKKPSLSETLINKTNQEKSH